MKTFLDRSLEALDAPQAEALCVEDVQRSDPCVRYGLLRDTPDACEAAVASCREEIAPGDASVVCRGVRFGPEERCDVSVAEYVGCLDAWRETQHCDRAGKLIETPDPCIPIVSRCDRFAHDFFQDGIPPPCPPAESEPPRAPRADEYGFDGCGPLPSRLIILGDSIAACWVLPDDICGPLLIGEHLQATVAPELSIESYAQSGSFFDELPSQARSVSGGPGHVLVWIFSIGNDLASTESTNYPAWEQAIGEVFDYFSDATRFPDGATFLLNTQYSPFDQCPDPPGTPTGISMELEQLIQDVNRRMFLDVAGQRDDTVAIDHYAPWLGHGNNADVAGCPHCGADNTSWMFDAVHPNEIGYREMANRWIATLDAMYGPDCGP